MRLSERMKVGILDEGLEGYGREELSAWIDEVAKLEEDNKHFAKVIDNIWKAANEEGTTVQGIRGQMIADALLEREL